MNRPALLLLTGCSGAGPASDPSPPPTARMDLVRMLAEDLATPRHPSDGGGAARLVEGTPAVAGRPGTWTLAFTAGPLGIAEGGMVFLQVSPFWGWSSPQAEDPLAPGFTEVATPASGVVLEAETFGSQLLGVRIRGRALAPGEEVRFRYGAGPAGALADRYAEGASWFWFAVDGDGDGVRALLPRAPSVPVAPGPAAWFPAALPSTARPGDEVRMAIAVLDGQGNAGVPFAGELALEAEPGLEAPARVRLEAADAGVASVSVRAGEVGTARIRVTGPGGLAGASNPILVSDAVPRVLWGDPHGHGDLSDGTGRPAEWYRYARDVAGLDFAALTEHDHWGPWPLDTRPDLWTELQAAAARAYAPGRFVTFVGYEWTSWIHGHRHVLFPGDAGTVFSSLSEATDTPAELVEALRPMGALAIPHHPAGGPVAVDGAETWDPEVVPVVEVASVHGSSEADDVPGAIYDAVPGRWVRDLVASGTAPGFVGGGDGHDGHPGLAHLAGGRGGLTAVLDAEPTREAILAAFRTHRVYATNGPRIVLFTTLGGRPMGGRVPAAAEAVLRIFALGTVDLDAVDLVRSGRVTSLDAGRQPAFEATLPLDGLAAGETVYVRVRQVDGGMAWSSPFLVTP